MEELSEHKVGRSGLTQVEDLGTSSQSLMNWREEEIVITEIDGEVMLEILARLLILVIGEQVFAGMVGVVPQSALDDVLADALRQAASIVVAHPA